MTLDADARPVMNTTINLVTGGITPGTIFGGVIVGLDALASPVDLTSIGMAGCFQYTDQVYVSLFFPQGANTASVALNVPNQIGLFLNCQSVGYDPSAGLTVLGAVSSNALELMSGDW